MICPNCTSAGPCMPHYLQHDYSSVTPPPDLLTPEERLRVEATRKGPVCYWEDLLAIIDRLAPPVRP